MWRYVAVKAAEPAPAAGTKDPKKDDNLTSKLYTKTKIYKGGNTLREYQLEGLNWLLRCWYGKRSCILADEMGLGKTVQVCTINYCDEFLQVARSQIVCFLEHLFEAENMKGPFLVAVPLSTIEHWKREVEAWSTMNLCVYHDTGGGREMRDVIREFEWYYKNRSRRLLKFHILVTTYDDLIKDYEELAEVPWRAVIVDEAHRYSTHVCNLIENVTPYGFKGFGLSTASS
jgi:chromodomain-helicase-DNA-binding protein 7